MAAFWKVVVLLLATHYFPAVKPFTRHHYRLLSSLFQLQQTPLDNSNLVEVSFRFPSGLLLTPADDSPAHIFCLLRHNTVQLRPHLRKVLLVEDALTNDMCRDLIQKTENFAASNGGWSSDRHTGYPTTDLPLDAVYGKFSPMHMHIAKSLLPEMAKFFNLNLDYLECAELFVCKYEYKEGKQTKLDAHIDGTPYSFVVALNNPSTEFTGGGTRFTSSDLTYRPSTAGTAVIFSGKNEHEGVAVTSGIRYILTGFCSYDNPDKSHSSFLAGYDRQYDGSAATARVTSARNPDDSLDDDDDSVQGIHSGDILRGIRIFDRSKADVESNSGILSRSDVADIRGAGEDKNSRLNGVDDASTLISLDGLTTSQVHQLVRDCGRLLDGRECTVLIERLPENDNDNGDTDVELTDLQCQQRHIRKISGSLLNKAKYWSFDYFLREGWEKPNTRLEGVEARRQSVLK